MPITFKRKNKRLGFALYAGILALLHFYASKYSEVAGRAYRPLFVGASGRLGGLILLVSLLGSYLVQHVSLRKSRGRFRGILVALLPLSLSFGVFVSFYHFPNFSLFFKVSILLVVALLYYLIELVNNIFLVVDEKADIFPLYRVAVAWSQILLVITAIPIYVGIYKFDWPVFVQAIVSGGFTLLFTVYYLWSLGFDGRVRRIFLADKFMMGLFSAYLVGASYLAVAFVPAAAFLRGLFSASVLLFVLNYMDGYVRNRLSRGLLYTYGFFCLVFLLLLFIFHP